MKMKTLVPILALVVLMVIPSLASARWVHDFSCDYCHKTNMVLDDVKTIVCLDCHSTGHEGDTFALNRTGPGFTEPVGQAIFSEGDASDALGSSTASGATPGDQTSHNWGASDNNPAAGASAPSDPLFYGNSNYSGATVSCGRCHDPHGAKTADARNAANPQLLKLGEGSTDTMCVDCHTSWNTSNANAFLTHPMITDYPGFQSANSIKYKPFTPNGEMALDASGNIVCSTCHGVHFTDSDATTTDGMGQPLSASDGSLLRGNGLMTGDATSLCTSCHVYKQHGAGQVGCIDCHSGHSYNTGTPNYFVLRDTVSLPSFPAGAPASPGTNLMYNSATYPWKNAGGGYCEGCHTLAPTHNGLNTGGQAECASCHAHDDTAAFTAGDCSSCHGFPPINGAVAGGPDGYAFDAAKGNDYSADPDFKNDTNAKHGLHAGSGAAEYKFDCGECHGGNTHNTGTFQDVFITPTTFVSANSALAPAYNKAGTGTCSAVYCHSNGGPRGAAPAASVIPAWVSGAATCASCHGNDGITMTAALNSGTHQAHLAKGYDCSVCHNSTATNSTTLVVGAIQGTHVNGTADVAFDGSGFTQLNAVAGVYNADGTCNTIYCHSDGANNAPATTPDWDLATTGQCGSCHDDTGEFLPDAHKTHVFDTDGPQLACNTCHTNAGSGAEHVNGFIDTVASMQTAVCNSCHGIDGAEVAPVWTVAGSDDCITCHTGSLLSTIGTLAPAKNDALSKGHNLASGNYPVSGFAAANQTCEDCHDKAATHLTGTGNKRLKVAFSCDTCHGTSGTATVNNINTHQAKLCLTCHDPHGSANIYMIKAGSADYSGTVGFARRTGFNSFDESDTANADDLCATCHTATTHNRADATGPTHNEGTDCQTCHKPHTDPVNAFAVGAGTSCDGCHGFPPATAAHVVHTVTTGNTIVTSDRSDCATCHTGADSYTYAGTGDQPGLNHGDVAGRDTILTAAVGFDPINKTCASACHTSTVGNGGTWTNGATLACDACHYYEATPLRANNVGTDFALTGNHNIHFDAIKTCADCHTVPGDLTHISTTAGVNDAETILNKSLATQDEATILGGLGSDPDPGNATCNNAACHNPSGDASEATWTVSTVSCDLCHSSSDPATNNHSAHLNAQATFGVSISCDSCHVDNLANMAHLNGAVDMAGQVTGFTDPNCTNNCHQDGRTGTAVVTATWGMVPQADCTICHTQQPATGSHGKHLLAVKDPAAGVTLISCNSCHDNTVDNTTAAAQHLDLNLDVFDTDGSTDPTDLGFKQNKALAQPATNCTTASCHTDGTNTTPVATPVWGTNSACLECHTTMTTNGPINGSHVKHMTTTMEPAINCGMCHASSTDPDTDTEPGFGHRDGNIDVLEGYPPNKTIGLAYASCSNAVDGALLCHDNGLGVVVASPIWGATPANCSTCHATQPATGSHTVHLAASATCGDCHTGAVEGTTPSAQHGDNNLDVTNGYPANVAKGSGTWTTCNAASCHNDGQSGNNADTGNVGSSLVTTPAWGTATACGECHVAVPSSAKHDEHLGSYGSTCGDCHATAGTGASAPTANHADGNIDVGANAIYSAAGAPGNGWGTCTNSAAGCHPAQTRNWDATGPACNSCHGQSTAGSGEPLIAGDFPSGGALPIGQHNTHVNTESMSCGACHTGGHNETNGLTGQDDKLQISFTGLGTGGTYNPPGLWTTAPDKWQYNQTSTNARQDCSNLYCHSSGQADGGVGAEIFAIPDWGVTTTGQCGTCHQGDGVQGNASTIATGSHTVHLADSADCNNCHSGNTHVNQLIDVTSVTYTAGGAPGNGYGTCSAASCHDNGTGTVVATPTWGTTATCTECHEAAPTTNAHPIHLGAGVGATCGDCHQGAVEGSNAGVAHRNNLINTVAGLGYSDTTKGAPYGTCATASCHQDGLGNDVVTPVWNVDAPNCTACHTAAPTTGSHSVHFTDGAVCNTCHDGAVESTTVSTNHLSNDVDVDATPTNTYANDPAVIGSGSWTTCSTASCHQNGQAANNYVVSPTWGATPANCTQCHEASPTSGSHTKHITINNDCVTCHTGAVKDVSYGDAAHRDNNVDVAVGSYTANKTLGAAEESCASISCHSDGLTGTSGTSPVWGTVTPNCTACHAAAPVTGSHTVHLADGATCSSCHKDAVESNTAPTVIHTDGDVDVFNSTAGDLGYPINAAIGSGSWSTCNAASCHDDGTGALVTTPTWGTASTCNECHSNVPTTNAHGLHLGLSGVNCGTCHTGAIQDVNAGVSHRDDILDTAVGLGYTDNTKGAPYGTCATASCHNNGLGVSVSSPAWNGTATCNSCHATTPTTGSHTKHISDGATCGNCHSDAVVNTTAPSGVHANANVDVFDITSTDLGYPATAALGSGSWTTCNAAACHDDGTGALVTTPIWGATPANCTACHASSPTSGAHQKHLTSGIIAQIDCATCHVGTTESATAGAGHRDGNIDVSGGYGYPLNKTKGSAYSTCNTSYCHGDTMPKGTTSGTTNAPNWNTTSTGCDFCHDMAPLAISAHAGKIATDCITCHDNTNAAGTAFVDPNLHVDGTLQGGGDSCTDCHSNVGSGLSGAHGAHNFVAFNGLLSNNDYGSVAAGWYDTSYINDAADGGKRKLNMSCGYCHPSTVAGHMTKQTSLSNSDAGAAGTLKALNGAGAAYNLGVCSNVYCHSDGAGTFSDSPSWTTGSLTGNCNDCHGNSPTTNAHSVHTVGIHYTDLYDSDRSGVMQAAAATNAAHGDIATSTTITCVICHGDTISITQNDQNDICVTCHTGGAIKGNLGIASASITHVNGQADVAFNMTGFKSKAQLRDDITVVAELNSSWTRTNGYKQVAGTSHDVSKGTAAFNAGTCSAIACHNNNSASWTDPVAGNCQKCHTELPQ